MLMLLHLQTEMEQLSERVGNGGARVLAAAREDAEAAGRDESDPPGARLDRETAVRAHVRLSPDTDGDGQKHFSAWIFTC